jgi:predicted nucleotidyltransferase/predicted transcriptional regulator
MIKKDNVIIKYLLEHKEEDINTNLIAKALQIDYKTTYNIIKRLEEENIVILKTFGKAQKIELNQNTNPLLFQTEFERKKEVLKNKDIKVMFDYFIKGLPSRLFILLIFGSYAKKKQTKQSDIDLFFIVSDEEYIRMEKSIHHITSLIPLKLHINLFKESEFLAMKKSKEFTVGSEVIKNNVILYGTEQYYELIQ